MTRTHHPQAGTHGYTLVELLLVLVLLAVVLSLAAPSMSGMLSANRAEGASSRIASDIMTARMEAARSGRQVRFVIADGARTAVVRTGVAGADPDTLRRLSLTQEFPGLTVVPSNLVLTFDSRGLVTSSTGQQVIQISRNGLTRKLTISSVGTVYRDTE